MSDSDECYICHGSEEIEWYDGDNLCHTLACPLCMEQNMAEAYTAQLRAAENAKLDEAITVIETKIEDGDTTRRRCIAAIEALKT